MVHSACVSVDTKTVPVGLSHAATFVSVENKTLDALIDSCASENFYQRENCRIVVSEDFSFFKTGNYDPEKLIFGLRDL